MSNVAAGTGIYSGSKFTFRDIVVNGKQGGSAGLKSYLTTRISQLTRKVNSANGGEEESRILLAITAMSDAIKIVDELSAKSKTLS